VVRAVEADGTAHGAGLWVPYGGTFVPMARAPGHPGDGGGCAVVRRRAAGLFHGLRRAAASSVRAGAAAAAATGVLAAAVAVIAVSSFAVWQVWPANAVMFLNLRVGEWPQGAVLFALGVLGAEAGWLDELPPVLARRLGWVAAAEVAALVTLMVSLVLARGADGALVIGADLPTMAFALLDGVIAVSGTGSSGGRLSGAVFMDIPVGGRVPGWGLAVPLRHRGGQWLRRGESGAARRMESRGFR
jgi:hypothetical protein